MKNATNSLLSLLSLLLLPSLAAAQGAGYAQQFDHVKEISVNLYHGDLVVTRSATGLVSISGPDHGPIKPVAKLSMGKLVFSEKSTIDGSSPDWPTWQLQVPDGFELQAQISGGEVRLQGVSGQVSCQTGAGGFQLTKFNGKARLSTGTGNIRIEDSAGNFQASTGTGNVSIERARGSFEGGSGTGMVMAVETTVTGKSSLQSGTGQVFFGGTSRVEADLALQSGINDATIELSGLGFEGVLNLRCGKADGEILADFNFDEERTEGRRSKATLVKTKRFGPSAVSVNVSTGTGKARAK